MFIKFVIRMGKFFMVQFHDRYYSKDVSHFY